MQIKYSTRATEDGVATTELMERKLLVECKNKEEDSALVYVI